MMENLNVIYALIERIVPEYREQIVCEYCEDIEGKDVYETDWDGDRLLLRGNNNISLAAALGRYLKYDAKVNITWCGGNFQVPDKLPRATRVRQVIEQKYRVYMNYCTFNYTASWWDFDRWEKEIDLMALNGINMPLTIVGAECCWYETLLEFGFTDEEAREFLAGPAFLAWQWMGNIEGFGGPLPMSWIRKRTALGKRILERMLAFGMQPIQQGFSGVVPRKLVEKYPDSRMQYQKSWNGFEPTVQLDPLDPLFREMGLCFLQKQKEIFGAYGFYAADPFHEGKPPVEGSAYLKDVGESIASLFCAFDPDYKWVMQAWSIRKDIACSVPKDRLLILDLAGGSYKGRENFWGYEFVAGNLHNFGGRIKLHGDLKLLAENAYEKLVKEELNVVGTGLFMEGIEQNPVYYDLAFEMLTKDQAVDLEEWIQEYIVRRYGRYDDNAKKAWDILIKTVYAPGSNGVERGSAVCTRPAVNLKKTGPGPGFLFPYGRKRLYQALEYLLMADCATDGYEFDVVDVLRQYLSDYAYELYTEVSRSFLNREPDVFERLSGQYLELMDDMDELLSIRSEYSFKKWMADAAKWAENDEEKRLYEYNAASLVTLWGSDAGSNLFDYAWREWSGLISLFYKERWKRFFGMLKEFLESGQEYQEDGLKLTVDARECFRANDFYAKLADWESRWLHEEKNYPVYDGISADQRDAGDHKWLIRKLMQKYIA